MKQDEKGGKRSADGFGESKHAGRLSGRATGDYPCAPTSELIQGFPVPPQNSPLAWQADPWYSRVDPCGQPWEVGLRGGAEVRAYGACSRSALFLFPTPQKE